MSETEPVSQTRKNRAESVVGRPFEKGNSGKPKGTLSKRTIARQDLLAWLDAGFDEEHLPPGCAGPLLPRIERIRQLITSRDESIRLDAEKWLASYEWPRPKLTLDVTGSVNISALLLAAFARVRPNGNGNGAGSSR